MAREMKNSGVEWIGNIPASWMLRRLQWCLKEVIEKNDPIKTTQILSLTNRQGVLPYEDKGAQGNKAKENLSEYKLAYKDTLIVNSMNVIIGSVGISHYFGCVSPVYYVFTETKESDLRFVNYIFNTIGFQKECRKFAKGILEIRLRISSSDLFKRLIPLPSIEEQKRIADYLDKECLEIDAILNKTHASIEEYKKLKQAIITQAVTKGIRGDKSMKESGIEWIGMVPEEWDVLKATRIIRSTQNGLSRRELNKSSGCIVLKLKNISPEGKIDLTFQNRIDLSPSEIDSYQLYNGDFLFVRVNGSKSLVGKCAIFKEIEEPVAYNDHIIRVRIYDTCYPAFFQWYLLSIPGKIEIELHTSTAAGQYTISGDGLRELNIPLPPRQEQRSIADYLDKRCGQIDAVITKKMQVIAELEEYKKSLIYEYVTGKKECPKYVH